MADQTEPNPMDELVAELLAGILAMLDRRLSFEAYADAREPEDGYVRRRRATIWATYCRLTPRISATSP